jgi:tetratricopeptide (TPR) repeat protein
MKRPTDKTEEQEWIERYLQGKMSEDERKHFETELAKDINLSMDTQQLQQAHRLMKEAFLEEQALATVRRLQAAGRSREKVIYWGRYLAAASVSGIIFVTYLSLSMPRFPDSENDFTVVRGASTTTMPLNQRAVFDQFFEGQAHIAEGQYILAVRNFETVLQSGDLRPYFKEAAQWHLVVAYLKSGDISRAENLYRKFDQCTDCEYTVGSVNRWKIWWQIHWKKLLP